MFLRYQQVSRLLDILKPKTIVEVGTWNGDQAILMASAALRHRRTVHYWGFDLFEQATQETDTYELNVRSHHSRSSVHEKLSNFASENQGFSFDLISGNSQDILPMFLESTWIDPGDGKQHQLKFADFAYIDGGHSVSTIASDYECLQSCGTILFDDYYEPDKLGQCPDLETFGCNKLLESVDHVILPAKDELPSGGFIRMAASGSNLMSKLKYEDKKDLAESAATRAVVTTFSLEGYYEYGARFIETFDRYWPEDVPLHVYCDEPLQIQASQRVHVHNFSVVCPDLIAFKARNISNPEASGQNRAPEEQYRFDALKFCHKVFALTHCAENIDTDELYWIDADSVTFKYVHHEFLQSLLPPQTFTSYLGRQRTHSECGFMAFNLKDPMCSEFMELFKNIYADDRVFELPEWHDSYVFDLVRDTYESKGLLRSHDLRDGMEDDHHPFINSPLGAVLDHLIGPRRKTAGCSFAADLKIPHEEFYWRVVPFFPEDLMRSFTSSTNYNHS
jgi:hypothetical protein